VARIFLCHASEDKAQVREVYQRLQAIEGFEPWLDEEDLLPGQDWNYEIEQALKTSDFIIAFLSTRSVKKRGYVQREFRRALYHAEETPEGHIHTIPVKLDECSVPHQFSRHQWVKLYEDGAFDRVVAAIRHGLQQRSQPAPKATETVALASAQAESEAKPSGDNHENVYSEANILNILSRSLSDLLDDKNREYTGEKFLWVPNISRS
jgi:hypothetical protein